MLDRLDALLVQLPAARPHLILARGGCGLPIVGRLLMAQVGGSDAERVTISLGCLRATSASYARAPTTRSSSLTAAVGLQPEPYLMANSATAT